MKKIGIFLGFGPNVSIKSEGIGRLIAFLIKANLSDEDRKEEFVIIYPKWFKKQFNELLEDQKILPEDLSTITTKHKRFGMVLYNILKKKEKGGRSLIKEILLKVLEGIKNKRIKNTVIGIFKVIRQPKNFIFEFASQEIINLVNSTNIINFLLNILKLSVMLICLIPFAILYLIFRIFKKIFRKVKSLLVNRFANKFDNKDDFIKRIYDSMVSEELKSLVNIVNKHNDINVCFIPSMFWAETSGLKMRKIIAAPDIVYYDFPTQFTLKAQFNINDKIRETLKFADHIICYSDYVKEFHLVKKCGIDEGKVSVIKHANVEMNKFLEVKKSIKRYMSEENKASEVLKVYFKENGNIFFDNSGFKDIQYIIYSSQYRPHKNIFNLIKAFKIVCKDNFKNIKLVLTGNLLEDNLIADFIEDNYLKNDIIQLYNIPTEVLAALNKFAMFSINPTLFEGGFPFTFSEAYSVGTPSLMSDIEMVSLEIEEDELKKMMLFNPYDINEMANKIIWALDNTKTLYEEEKKLFDKFKERDWGKVAKEYCCVFESNS